jgi:hypothetical protein
MLRLGTLFVTAALLLLLASACGNDGDRESEQSPAPPTEQTSAEPSLPLHLYVSNQSFDPREVDITVWIDDKEVINQEFDVQGQHNWILFDLSLREGPHLLRAEAKGQDAVLEINFELAVETWSVLEFWKDEGAAFFTWNESDQPVGFD